MASGNDNDFDAFTSAKLNYSNYQVDDVIFWENTGTVTSPIFTRRGGLTSNSSGASPLNPLDRTQLGNFPGTGFADIDNDGDLDMVGGSGSLQYFENTGTANNPVFVERAGAQNPFDGLTSGIFLHPDLIDYDGDGDIDLMLGNNAGGVEFYENTGTVTTPNYVLMTQSPFDTIDVGQFSTTAFGDFDNDGVLEFLAGEYNGGFYYFEPDYPCPTVNITNNQTTFCSNEGPIALTVDSTGGTFTGSGVTGTSFSPISAGIGTHTVTYTYSNGSGCTVSATQNFTVIASPTVMASSTDTVVCSGESITLTGIGATGYVWDNGAVDGIAFVPSATTTYNVTGTDGNGCSATGNLTITVDTLPIVMASSTDTVVCSGESITLTGIGATGYVWDNGAVDGIAFVPSATTTYNVTGTDGNGCSATGNLTITVDTLPIVMASSTDTVVCSGESITLTGIGAASYVWDNGAVDGIAFVPSATTTYNVTGTDGNGCSATGNLTITVDTLPIVMASSTDTVVCSGESITLTGIGAASYVWDNGAVDGIAFVPSATTTYNVTGTDGNGCSATGNLTITVDTLPIVMASSTDTVVCSGESITLTGIGAASYVWDNGAVDGIAFVPSATTTYNVTGTDGNGCSATGNLTITVDTLPIVMASSTDTVVCSGESITLTGIGAASYAWDNGAVDGIAFVPSATTTYNVTGTDGNGCSATGNLTITVDTLPIVMASSTDTVVCSGESITLTGIGAASYVWDNGAVDGIAFVPSATTTYNVTGTDGNGCSATGNLTITVDTLPIVMASSTDTVVCSGESITLTGIGAASYVWDNGAVDGIAFVPSATTTYNVTGTDGNGCSATGNLTITVDTLPIVMASSTDTVVCSGESITLTGIGAASYAWDNGAVDGIAFVPSTTTTYNVTGTDGNGCTANTQLTIQVTSIDTSLSLVGNTLMATTMAATYQWVNCDNNQWINGATNSTFTPDSTGNYAVIITNNNCVDTSNCYNILVVGMTMLNSPIFDSVKVFPNPNTGTFTLEFINAKYESNTIEIINSVGQIVYQTTTSNDKEQVHLHNIRSGLYVIYINGLYTQKIIIK